MMRLILVILVFFISLNAAVAEKSKFTSGGYRVEASERIWANYVDTVQQLVAEKWKPKGFLESYYAVVEFELNPDGSLKKIELVQKSSNKEYDTLALDTVRLAAPFKELPTTIKPIRIKYYFDYKYRTEDFVLDTGILKD